MNNLHAAGFLVSLLSISASVSLLMAGLALSKGRLLTRYRARTLYQIGLLLTALLLCPWRPALLLPKITLPAPPAQEVAVHPKDTSLPSASTAQAFGKTDRSASPDTAAEASFDPSGDMERQVKTPQALAPSTHQAFSIARTLFAVWLAGALMVLLFQSIRHARFLRLVRRWQGPVPQGVQVALAEQSARLGIRPPPAYTAPCVQSPTVVGLLRPMLLLPAIAYDPQQLNLMLTHELIHYKHGHLWGKALGCLALAVHWFNPIMPFVLREMGSMCEMACDETVLTLEAPEHRSVYVDAILNAALLTRAARTPLCSPLNGGVKQMNQIKQRIALMTPFRPRRTGIGLIACMLLLVLLTGSVLADQVPASAFSIPESDWVTSASGYMPQADYDLVMSMQTPGWEELTTEAFAQQLEPQWLELKRIFERYWPENRFMRHLRYSVAEASDLVDAQYQVLWNTGFWREDQSGGVLLRCTLHWSYLENGKLTCAQRNQLLDAALVRADRAVRTLNIPELQATSSAKDANAAFSVQLNEMAKQLGGSALSIWFTEVSMDTISLQKSQITQEQREQLSLLTPEGYRDQTIAEYQVLLEKYQDRLDQVVWKPMENEDHQIISEMYGELKGYPGATYSVTVDRSLLPAWTMRGDISYWYQLEVKTVDPYHVTVGQRHDALAGLVAHIRNEAAEAVWAVSDWEAFDKILKERLPIIAQEESSPALTFTVSQVGLDLWPLATQEYVHSAPLHVLKAFMTSCYRRESAQMAAVCAPVGPNARQAELSASRQELLKSFIEMQQPYYWTFGEARKEPGKDDVVIVDVTFYLAPPKGVKTPVGESREARLQQIDGKWYLLPESLQL